MSHIQIAGNITEPELKYTASGKAMAKFGLYETRLKNDEKIKTWYNVVVFDAMAEHLCASNLKGRRLIVVGRFEGDDWTDKDGNKKTSFSVIADEIALSMRWGSIAGDDVQTPAQATQYAEAEEPF